MLLVAHLHFANRTKPTKNVKELAVNYDDDGRAYRSTDYGNHWPIITVIDIKNKTWTGEVLSEYIYKGFNVKLQVRQCQKIIRSKKSKQ